MKAWDDVTERKREKAALAAVDKGTPITINGVTVGKVLERHEDGSLTVYMDPTCAPVHGYSPELGYSVGVA